MERTLVILKPNALMRGLVGELLHRFESRGMRIAAMRMTTIDRDTAARHYAEHRGKEFYEGLLDFITSGPSVLVILESPGAVAAVRSMVGATDPAEAEPGTIRGDYALSVRKNLVHASDSLESAEREIAIFFGGDGIEDYSLPSEPWI
jgi:nucleoside-diphosphate kinase